MKIRALFLFLLLSPGIRATAQYNVSLSLIGEYSQNQFQTSGINSFVSGFNDFWGSKLSAPYAQFTGTELSHPNFGLGIRFYSGEKVGFAASSALLYGQSTYAHQSEWSTGVKNELAFKTRDAMWTFTMGLHFWKVLFTEFYLDANARFLDMEHATLYPDGSRSLSSEYKLNGFYTGLIASFDVGFQASVRLGPVPILKLLPPIPLGLFHRIWA